ncbi:MAG: SDR family NAD(P)-dependent oxidoreductase, partial [Giesbergeria sp.]
MKFLQYVLQEIKSGRLSQSLALELVSQYHEGRDTGGSSQPQALHPLLQRNTSTLAEQRFCTEFTGQETFLADHLVQGEKVLPAAAQLEMAHEAVRRALELPPHALRITLEDMVFARPVVVADGPLALQIGLMLQDDGSISYEIFAGDGEEAVVHGRGRAVIEGPQPSVALELPQVLEEERQMAPGECYAAFAAMGLHYGPAHRVLQALRVGRDALGRATAVAEIALPPFLEADRQPYLLHPSLLDGALQAGIGLAWPTARTGSGPALLPFAMDRLQVFAPLPPRATVVVRHAANAGSNDAERKLDITIAGPDGQVVARLNGYGCRAVAPRSVGGQTLLAAPVWRRPDGVTLPSAWQRHVVLLAGLAQPGLADAVGAVLPEAQCVLLRGEGRTLADDYGDIAGQLLLQLQALLAQPGSVRVQLAVPDGDAAQALLRGLGAMLKTAQQELPQLHAQLLLLDASCQADVLAARIAEQADRAAQELRCRGGEWQQAGLEAVDAMPACDSAWKAGDVVLITGGAGGLGRHCSHALAALGCTVVLAGRSALADTDAGGAIEYRQADVADAAAVQALVADILARHGRLDGVLHAAGTLRDGLLPTKTVADLQAVLQAKVAGLVHLDQATASVGLKQFVLFSSISAVFGHIGQADYAAANGFMDAYAHQRNAWVAQGRRQGRTVAVNWPLWSGGAMQMPTSAQEYLQALTGMAPLPAAAGLAALQQVLALAAPQLVVLHGDTDKLQRKLLGAAPPMAAATGQTEAAADAHELAVRIQAALAVLAAEQLKLPVHDMDGDTSFDEFGFDSVSLTTFANTLNRRYGLETTPTVLFEHSSLASLALHLAVQQRSALLPYFGVAGQAPAEPAPRQAPVAAPLPPSARRQHRRGARQALPPQPCAPASVAEPVAIIGVSGRFPQANDLDAFWANLQAGVDCIGQLPEDRWDWAALGDETGAGSDDAAVRQAGVIDGLDEFDPQFFGISPREAESMDPQQRLLMMYVWKAIEDAGYAAQSLSGSQTALIVGTSTSGYAQRLRQAGEAIEGHSSTGMVSSVGPNRMSFLLNLHGPSEPVETACSSALVAIHRAVELLQSGRCTLAIAGGVNTLISPEIHQSFRKAGMLSPDGRCKTFSDQANGYVRGEGVGMLLLKPLSAAERDGDHIYALIRGSAENHGGKANSLTAPNPRAQADLIKAAIRLSGLEPADISYIEAHGTGTPLGDPIEAQGLKTAFQELAAERGQPLPAAFCGLGSVKTNIGHLELAAGVAGVLKVVLQMQHRTLVPSLHCERINPYIDLAGSPFYMVREKRPWQPTLDAHGQPLPRRAGVSSFGFGGVNAHLILEEYVARDGARPVAATGPVLVLLSARNSERLRERVRQLLQAIEQQALGQEDIADLAYTLQVGRDAMQVRLACLVGTMDALRDKLVRYLAGDALIENLYRGEEIRSQESVAVFAADEELQEAIGKWVRRGKIGKLAELWVRGLAFDWMRLYADARPRRIGLPTYPFARERYWVRHDSSPDGQPLAGTAPLHPLLQRNTSTLAQQRFSTSFSGKEFFLAEHVVRGIRVLPGVAQLEMARAAACAALELDVHAPVVLRLQRVVFSRPITVGQAPEAFHLALTPEADGQTSFHIYQLQQGSEPAIHSQGRIELGQPAPLQHDLAALQASCGRQRVSAEQCYGVFASKGLALGPGFRAIQEIHVGDRQVLARLELPATVAGQARLFTLHPSLMDAALQSSVGLMIASGQVDTRLALPFALDQLEVFGPTTARMWSHARLSAGSQAGDPVQKLDFDLCDDEGRVCVR